MQQVNGSMWRNRWHVKTRTPVRPAACGPPCDVTGSSGLPSQRHADGRPGCAHWAPQVRSVRCSAPETEDTRPRERETDRETEGDRESVLRCCWIWFQFSGRKRRPRGVSCARCALFVNVRFSGQGRTRGSKAEWMRRFVNWCVRVREWRWLHRASGWLRLRGGRVSTVCCGVLGASIGHRLHLSPHCAAVREPCVTAVDVMEEF